MNNAEHLANINIFAKWIAAQSGLTVFTALVVIIAAIFLIYRRYSKTLKKYRDTGGAFNMFMATTPEFLAVINEQARVKYMSRAFAKWLGISDNVYAEDRPFLDLCGKGGMRPTIHRIIENGGEAKEMLEINNGGEKTYLMLRSFPMGGGAIERTFELADVTSMVEAKMTAEESDRQKSSFLANMSHEIRTPMNAIVGTMELLLTTPLSDEQQAYASTVKNSAISLLTIINDILDISKLSAGKMKLMPAVFDAASMINDTLNVVNIKAVTAGLSLTAIISKEIPPKINGDEVRIKQCLLNLMNNAVKFTRHGNVCLTASCEQAGEKLKLNFSVADTGIGIKKADIDKLFDSFTRLDAKKNRAVDGTGLGLAITKNLVEMMGGRISVSSTYGKGTTFSFYIICESASEGQLAYLQNPEALRVLAYEPDKYHADSLRAMLKELGVWHDVCRAPEDYKTYLASGGEYTHVLCDKSIIPRLQNMPVPRANFVITREMQDTNLNMPSICKPLQITTLAHYLGGIVADSGALDREEKKITLGAFKTKNVRVLLVDDNPVNLTVAAEILRKYGIDVVTAADGKEGLRKIQKYDFDAAFFDHMMPVMDGIEAASAVRALGGRYETIPIIALTANAVSGAKAMFIEAGMNGFLSKPIMIKDLHDTLLEFLPPEKIVDPTVDYGLITSIRDNL